MWVGLRGEELRLRWGGRGVRGVGGVGQAGREDKKRRQTVPALEKCTPNRDRVYSRMET